MNLCAGVTTAPVVQYKSGIYYSKICRICIKEWFASRAKSSCLLWFRDESGIAEVLTFLALAQAKIFGESRSDNFESQDFAIPSIQECLCPKRWSCSSFSFRQRITLFLLSQSRFWENYDPAIYVQKVIRWWCGLLPPISICQLSRSILLTFSYNDQ